MSSVESARAGTEEFSALPPQVTRTAAGEPATLLEAISEAALAPELTEVEHAARVAVEHAVGRLGKEPGPRTRDALVPVLTDLPVVAPWTRLTPPTPADRTPVEVER